MRTLGIKSVFAFSIFLCSLHGIVSAPAVTADTQYVSDLLIISVKDGQDPDAPVLEYLRSATPVDVLEETDELMRIETEDGTQGWVRKKFIVKEKPKAIIIMELEERIALLEDDIKTLREASDSQGLTNTIIENRQQIASLTASLENEKKASLDLQANLAQLNATHQALVDKHKNVADNLKELASLKEENKLLKDKIAAMPPPDSTPVMSGNMKWFLIGGGVLLLGFIMGRFVRRGEKRAFRY